MKKFEVGQNVLRTSGRGDDCAFETVKISQVTGDGVIKIAGRDEEFYPSGNLKEANAPNAEAESNDQQNLKDTDTVEIFPLFDDFDKAVKRTLAAKMGPTSGTLNHLMRLSLRARKRDFFQS